jgi:hypothetical protein
MAVRVIGSRGVQPRTIGVAEAGVAGVANCGIRLAHGVPIGIRHVLDVGSITDGVAEWQAAASAVSRIGCATGMASNIVRPGVGAPAREAAALASETDQAIGRHHAVAQISAASLTCQAPILVRIVLVAAVVPPLHPTMRPHSR